MNNLLENFGTNCFSEKNLKNRVPDYVFKKFLKIREGKEELTIEIADIIANAIKMWALEKGTTHYTHWFQPLTELTAEKHESFISINPDGTSMAKFSGKELIKGESDTSSFPNGGLRSTFEARGYTAWDINSPMFLKGEEGCKTLYIPTAFVAYNGEALDKKVPLLRSIKTLRNEVLKLQKLLGDNETENINVTLGVEQEYFLIDKNFFYKRQDLALSGRTVFGCLPPKGQEMNDHYYGTIKERIEIFMAELDNELWKLGVMSKTKHNEVAPNQFEIALMFNTANVAIDQNQITMDMIKKVANRHNLVALLHEKPFHGVNGSGKHCNWSLSTDRGVNLYDPDTLSKDNFSFLVYLMAMIEAVDKYAPVLRATTATPGNDHRLGGHEAPPAIISIFLGEQLENLLENIENINFENKSTTNELEIGFHIPKIKKDISDRNRTSPMAFTGNKFEFRMPGSSASPATPTFVLNTIVADVIKEYNKFLEESLKTKSIKNSIISLIKDKYPKHKKIIFDGNGYEQKWIDEAKKRGLPNLKNTIEGLPAFIEEDIIQLFERNNVLSRSESFSRFHVYTERYNKQCNIEISTAIRIARNQIYPFVIKYISNLAKSIHRAKKIFNEESLFEFDINLLKEIILLKNDIVTLANDLEKNLTEALKVETDYHRAVFYNNNVFPILKNLRFAVDSLELKIASDAWPIPSYYDLLFKL
ncbi:MAG: glutamine synthetase III [Fusobacterium sp.]|uniref:glutamine synthetase III family protein n=1 Tax=Fusobacterium sp. TaxID=68766 RepID=UPI0026DB166F|nr:glutamine synthetase III [Fusobacterium sp.]MDO4690384.1 glutamine synthetase III [Fusobacterium sp.]